jgi:hypothetical protein
VLRAHVADAGDELVSEYVDDGHSGARLDRPALDALRDAAEGGLFEQVWLLVPGPAGPRLRLPSQLALPVPGESNEPCWSTLPLEARAAVLGLLARLIARGVIVEEPPAGRHE